MMRQAIRGLVRRPGYSVSVILTIALSAAAAGAGGGVLYRMLLVPRLAAEPVVMIEPYEAGSGNVVRMSPREYQDWIAQESLFSDAAARSRANRRSGALQTSFTTTRSAASGYGCSSGGYP